MDKKEKKPDPFASMGPPGIARRFGAVPTEEDPTRKRERVVPLLQETKLTDQANDKATWLAEERKKIAEAALVQLEDKPKHAGGRPAKVGRPWEGICSKTEWYRRRKAKEEKA